MRTKFLIIGILLAGQLGCSVKVDGGKSGQGPATPGETPANAPQNVQNIPRIFAPSESPDWDGYSVVEAVPGSRQDSVNWFKLPDGHQPLLSIFGSQVAGMSEEGNVCDTRRFKLIKDWVVFSSPGIIESVSRIDDFNSGAFFAEPGKVGLIRATFQGDFSNCAGATAMFYVRSLANDARPIQLQPGMYRANFSTESFKVEGSYPYFLLSLNANASARLVCYSGNCLGTDSQNQVWTISLESTSAFRIAKLEDADFKRLTFRRGLNPRTLDSRMPFLEALHGAWQGTLEIRSGSGGITNLPIDVNMVYRYQDRDRRRILRVELDFPRMPNEFSNLNAVVTDQGQIVNDCVFSERPVGRYSGGTRIEWGTLNNSCQNPENNVFSIEKLSDTQVRIFGTSGSNRYSADLTAW